MSMAKPVALLALTAALGCSPEASPVAADGWPAAAPIEGRTLRTAPPIAPALTLTVDQIIPGDQTTFTITGAGPSEQVKLARSTSGAGLGPCLGTLGGLCLDITNPTLHATVTADLNGTATLVQTIPETVPIGANVWFQAVVARGATGTLWIKSSEVPLPVDDAPLRSVAMNAGDLVLTEVMFNPAAVADGNGEWFEVHNVSGLDANLDGLRITDGVTTHTVTGTTFLAAGERLVFGVNDDVATNGGVVVDRVAPLYSRTSSASCSCSTARPWSTAWAGTTAAASPCRPAAVCPWRSGRTTRATTSGMPGAPASRPMAPATTARRAR